MVKNKNIRRVFIFMRCHDADIPKYNYVSETD